MVKANLTRKPLTISQIKNLWNTTPLYIEWGDGSDSLCQENGYSLSEIIQHVNQGCNVFIDI